jgi:outer membrane receptor for ferrienterochelin and colicins
MKSHTRMLTMVFSVVVFAGGVPQALFSQEQTESAKKLSELSLSDLLNMQVITASKQSESSADAPGIISVLTKDDLDRFGATTLKDVLERVPGLISSVGFLSDRTLIAARGDQVKSNSGHVLLLINGRPSRDAIASQNSDLYETFPVNIIEKIEVIKGPGSVLYGSDAFSAVINIITKTAEKNAFSMTNLAGNGWASGTSGDLRLKAGDVSVVAAGRYYKKAKWEDNYKTIDYVTTFVPVNIPVDILDRGPGAYLELDYQGLSLMSTYTDWTTTYFTSGAAGRVEWIRRFGNLGYEYDASEKWKMDFNVTYVHSAIDAADMVQAKSDNVIAEWTNSIRLTERSNVVLGGLYNYNNIFEIASLLGIEGVAADANQSSYALYGQMDYRLLDNLKLIGGLQANKAEKISMNIVPRVGVIWQPVSRLSAKALYSEAFKAPFLTERYFNIPMVKGNPNLIPEEVATIDIGLSYQGEQVQAGVNYFQSKQTNIIQLDLFGGTYSNLGKVDFHGFEFEGKYYFNRSLYICGSALYQQNRDGNGNENVTPIANLGFKAGISYAWENGTTISLFDIYQGDLDKRFKDNLNTDQGAYNLLHLYGKVTLHKALALVFDIKNLLNERHYAYNWGDLYPNVVPANPGRAIYFGLNVSL